MATSVKTRKTVKPAAKRDANGRFVAAAKPAGVAGTGEYTLWKDIEKQYPDHHILLENPVFRKDHSQIIEKGILLCAILKIDFDASKVSRIQGFRPFAGQ
ncbi:hypothetical protein FACS189430_11700 [Bacteroidia bacterium]|nr:hypothetical protein FACS189430_11700 [Bacteroidia bacterium]